MESYKGYRFKVEQDTDVDSPRTWDNIGTMVCFHKEYNLGDKHEYKSTDYSNFVDMKIELRKVYDGILLPLYLYDHSGLTISTTPFSCQWDSMPVGFIGVSHADIVKEYSKDAYQRALDYLLGEVKTYSQYLRGEVYGYSVYSLDCCCKVIDSCWDIYGYDEAVKSAKEDIDYRVSDSEKVVA